MPKCSETSQLMKNHVIFRFLVFYSKFFNNENVKHLTILQFNETMWNFFSIYFSNFFFFITVKLILSPHFGLPLRSGTPFILNSCINAWKLFSLRNRILIYILKWKQILLLLDTRLHPMPDLNSESWVACSSFICTSCLTTNI